MKQPTLPSFESNSVQQAQIRIVGAGDGLSEALKVAPVALQLGQDVYYVLHGRVTQVNHRQKDEDEPVVRLHTVKALAATEIEAEVAQKALQAAVEETSRRRAELEGQTRIEDE